MTNQYSVKYNSYILVQYHGFSPHYLSTLMRMSHLGTILKILSDYKCGVLHSQPFTSSHIHSLTFVVSTKSEEVLHVPRLPCFIFGPKSKLQIYQLCS